MIIETQSSPGVVHRVKFSKPRMALRYVEAHTLNDTIKLSPDNTTMTIEGRANVINALKALVGSTV